MIRKIRRLARKSFLLRIIAAGMTYVFIIAMARIMTVEDFGVIGTLMSGTLLLSVIGSFGQRLVLLRFVPPLLEQGVPIENTVRRAFRTAIVGNIVMYTMLVVALFTLSDLSWEAKISWAIGLLTVPLVGVIDMQSFLARGYRSLLVALVPKDILWRVVTLMILGSIFVLSEEMISLRVAVSTLVFVLVALVFANTMVLPKYVGTPSFALLLAKPDEAVDVEWKKSSPNFWILSISQVAYSNLDVLIVAVFLGPEVAGLYFAANRVALILSLFEQSLNIVIGPEISVHAEQKNQKALQDLACEAVIQTVVPTLLASAALAALSTFVLLVMGPEYAAAKPILLILLAGWTVTTLFGAAEHFMSLSGNEHTALKVSLISLSICVTFVLVGVLVWGPQGGAVAIALSTTLRKLLSWLACRSLLGVRTDFIFAVRDKLKARRA